MDRKEGVIHLGRSKSPSRPKTKSITSQLRNQSYASTRQRQQHQQFVMNRSMNVNCPSRVGLVDRTNYSNTSPLFFPPSQKLLQQKLVVRENTNRQTPQKVAVISTSPFKRIVVSRPLSTTQNSHHIQNQNNAFQRQQQLLRKIRVLQNRIQQIHQEKQTVIVRTHEQTKRFHNDNLILKNRLQQLTNILNMKNTQIIELTKENNSLKNLLSNQLHVVRADKVQKTIKPSVFRQSNNKNQIWKQQQLQEKSHASLKNSPYYDDQQENVSILKKQSKDNKNDQIFNDTLTQLQAQYKKLQENNQQLIEKLHEKQLQIKKWSLSSTQLAERLQNSDKQKKQLVQQLQTIKQSIHNNSMIIQENNKKIIDNYDNKIRLLNAQLDHIKGQINENQLLKSQLQLCRAEIEDYIRKLFQSDQQCLRKQQKWRIQANNYTYIIKQAEQKHQQSLKKIEQLQSIIKLSRNNKQRTQEQTPTQTEQQKTTKQQCKKCKQLIKTLLKLNQKVYSQTS